MIGHGPTTPPCTPTSPAYDTAPAPSTTPPATFDETLSPAPVLTTPVQQYLPVTGEASDMAAFTGVLLVIVGILLLSVVWMLWKGDRHER